eukprot:m.336099 g.336099  ORF g.336099 m.336099 type:complete len:261 (-) comp55690_c0_seq4:726-1508(-)
MPDVSCGSSVLSPLRSPHSQFLRPPRVGGFWLRPPLSCCFLFFVFCDSCSFLFVGERAKRTHGQQSRSMQRATRISKELGQLRREPPPGICCWCAESALDRLDATILGVEGTAYAGGLFKLEVLVPERYPFEPPKVRFLTPIYHPNIDTSGRICLDVLKPQPSGTWKPSWNIGTVLTSIQLLMSQPNPEDGLLEEVSKEFKENREQFERTAREWTARHAAGQPPPQTQEEGNKEPAIVAGQKREPDEDLKPDAKLAKVST